MDHVDIIARAAGGEPLRRLALGGENGVVFIANPESLGRIAARETYPVGFPQDDVFEFNEGVFAALVEQWACQRATDPATWQKLRRHEPGWAASLG